MILLGWDFHKFPTVRTCGVLTYIISTQNSIKQKKNTCLLISSMKKKRVDVIRPRGTNDLVWCWKDTGWLAAAVPLHI